MTGPLPEKVDVLVNVFTYARQVGADVFAYCCGVGPALADHPRVGKVVVSYTHGYPTDRCRNAACKQARDDGFHLLVMIDDDMVPDVVPGAKPFLPSAIDFVLAHPGPCLVGAPYCSGPPTQDVLVMKNRAYCPDQPDGLGQRMDKFTRDEAAAATGFERVAALPTGLLLVDLRVLGVLPPPWFSYEFADPPFNTKLASTEDVVFTRNLDWLGVPQFVAWDSWAGHSKAFVTGKPRRCPVDEIPQSVYKAWAAGWRPAVTP